MKISVIEEGRKSQWSELLDAAFRYPRPQSRHYFDDFPVWNPAHQRTRVERLGAFTSAGEIAASAAGRIADVRSKNGSFKVGIIGAVATHPDHRKKGLATSLIQEVEQRLEAQGAELLVLWGSEHEFYAKLGLELAGLQVRAPLKDLFEEAVPSDPDAIQIREGWNTALFEELKKRNEGIVVEDSDQNWISGHANIHWLRAERGERIEAYLGFGKGADLPGIVHEWGGNPAALLPLFHHLLKSHPEAELIASPEGAESLKIKVKEEWLEYLALLKVLRPDRFGFGPVPSPAHLFGPAARSFPLWFWGTDAG